MVWITASNITELLDQIIIDKSNQSLELAFPVIKYAELPSVDAKPTGKIVTVSLKVRSTALNQTEFDLTFEFQQIRVGAQLQRQDT